jgi:hypothetical protein
MQHLDLIERQVDHGDESVQEEERLLGETLEETFSRREYTVRCALELLIRRMAVRRDDERVSFDANLDFALGAEVELL